MRKISIVLLFTILPNVFSANTNSPESKVIAFVSDTQAPMWIEGVFLKEDNNPEATRRIMSNILEQRPATLYMLGDVVSLGPSSRSWISIDYFLKEFVKDTIPVYGLLGNHELMSRPAKGERIFQEHFPDHVRTGYMKITDSVAVLLMNSNQSSLSENETKLQFDWFNKTLADLDNNDAVKAVIVTCHHSPFTNSRLVSPSGFVQKNFIPGFIKSHKAKLFLSGHAHRFEYFKYEGKDFLVIGGGGGLSHPAGKKGVRFPDLAASYKPAFHYLTIIRSNDSLHVISHALKKDFSEFEIGYKINIPLNDD